MIATRSAAHLKRPPLVVVLHSPFVAANYAEEISHGSPSSTSVRMALTLHGWDVPSVLACLRASALLGFGNTEAVSTEDQTLAAELHGEGLSESLLPHN